MNGGELVELKQYEEKVIFKHFDNDNDHQYIHGIEVMNMANDIKDVLKLDISRVLIFLAAISHDVEANKGESHHEEAYKFVKDNADLIMEEYRLEEGEVNLVAMACLQHKRNFDKNFHSGLSELIFVANKMVSGGYDSFLLKSYLNAVTEEHRSHQEVVLYLFEKFDELFFHKQKRFPVLYEHYLKAEKKRKVNLLSKYLDYYLEKNPSLKRRSYVLDMNSFNQ